MLFKCFVSHPQRLSIEDRRLDDFHMPLCRRAVSLAKVIAHGDNSIWMARQYLDKSKIGDHTVIMPLLSALDSMYHIVCITSNGVGLMSSNLARKRSR